MRIIITAGGTSENIDNVRKITNNSSGKLGTLILDEFIKKYDKNLKKIYFLCPKHIKIDENNEKIEKVNITNVESLQDNLTRILTEKHIDAVIHLMAVSDYTLGYVTTSEILSKNLENKSAEDIKNLLLSSSFALDNSSKISSNCDDLVIKLKPTKKVISTIKTLSPKTFLVGFKLLSHVSYDNLICVAKNLLEKNNCDLVVANDLSSITNTTHEAHFVSKDKVISTHHTKQEIAENLAKYVMEKIKN